MDIPLLSVCLIVRDEGARLAACLERLTPIAGELVVADTGSVDDTVSIAEANGARVVHLEWRDDFAAARNACMDAATGSWVLFVDADEQLRPVERRRVETMLRRATEPAFTVEVISPRGGGRVEVAHITRLFRRAAAHRYEGRIHENVLGSICRVLGRDTWTPPRSGLVLEHEGYTPEMRAARGKHERNRRLLLEAIADRPKDPGPRFLFARENAAEAGGDVLDLPASREVLLQLAPVLAGLLESPRGITEPAVALGIRLAVACGDIDRATHWSEALTTVHGDTCRGLYARGVIELAAALAAPDPQRAELATLAERTFRAARRAADGSAPIPAEPELRDHHAPARAALASLIGGDAAAGLALPAEGIGLDGALVRALATAITKGPAEAVPLLAAALKTDGQDPRAWCAMSLLVGRLGDKERERSMAETALKLAPGWTAAEDRLNGRRIAPQAGLIAGWELL